ncbi:MAG TPA: MBL fold metallo-hydrolase [Anaerolineae bacterium]|jgi:phosphoribosyl 1,2-cyclic phosphodiesterase|nr:MBL fold metallo-hydrolase [Anaerolineae bacterium]
MGNHDYIKFLGTAGGRFVVAKQLRSSAGTLISIKGKNILLDPGPGTLVRCATARPRIDLNKIDAIILTHAHLDHSTDVNALIDAITEGGLKKRGVLFAPDECLNGDNAVVLKYLRDYLQEITVLRASSEYRVGEVAFKTSIRHQHGVEAYGIKFDIDGLKVSFMVDTKYFPELIDDYADSNILILNVVMDKVHPEYGKILHLYYEDAVNIIKAIKPQKAILTHFGMTMLKAKPWVLTKELSNELGIDIVAASDGMTVVL